MTTNKQRERAQLIGYIAVDAFSAAAAYLAVHLLRKLVIEPRRFGYDVAVKWDLRFWEGIAFTAALYLVLSALSGVYRDVLRRSRAFDFFTTLGTVVLTSIVLFFAVFLNDYIKTYNDYYLTLGTFAAVLFVLSAATRLALSTRLRRAINKGRIYFPALLVGCGKEANDLIKSFKNKTVKGYKWVGYLSTGSDCQLDAAHGISHLGHLEQAIDILNDNQCEDVIIAPEANEIDLGTLVAQLEKTDVRIHVLPNLFSILSGQVKMESIGRSLIEVKRELIKPHVAVVKRLFDLFAAAVLLLLASPIILFSMLMIAVGSKGPVFYKQNRLGKGGRTFKIIKLRSMYVDAEKMGPQLSSENDPRITPWGRTMRKYRFDELPQFINVLKGDMSIVGPRPERAYYFEQIVAAAPQYAHLLKVKPGITSWGMVKYGYAENVEEMLERARYDLIYTENITLINDIKILFYTFVTVVQGRGQ